MDSLSYVSIYVAAATVVAGCAFLLRDLVRGRAAAEGAAGGSAVLPQFSPLLDAPPATSLTGQIDHAFGRLVLGAGVEGAPEAAFLLVLLCGVAVGGALLVWRDDPISAAAGGAAGIAAALAALAWRRARRLRALRAQLPDLAGIMARAVRAGESVDQAIALAGECLRAPLGPELQRASGHLALGLSLSATLRSLARRVPLVEMRIFIAALTVHRQAGGNLPHALERLAAVVRDRAAYYRHVQASTAAGRMGTLIIAAAGPLVALYMYHWQQEYFRKFWEVPHGLWLLGAAVALETIGLVWVWRVLRTNY